MTRWIRRGHCSPKNSWIAFTGGLLTVAGWGCQAKMTNPTLRFPGIVAAALPFSERISPAQFNQYWSSGRLAPYRANGDERYALWQGSAVGLDLFEVKAYLSAHPEHQVRFRGMQVLRSRQLTSGPTQQAPEDEVQQEPSQSDGISLTDSTYQLAAWARTIRKNEETAALLLQPFSFRSAPRRALASVAESGSFRGCLPSELGHGTGRDQGGIAPASSSSAPLTPAADGLWAHFDWPLKVVTSCVKFQGIRGTCTAFSVIAALEILVAQREQKAINLSEQELYFHGKGFWDPYSPNDDAFAAEFFLEKMVQEGSLYRVPPEKVWNYNTSPGRTSGSRFEGSCEGGSYSEFCSNSPGQGKLVCTQPEPSDPVQCGYLSQVADFSQGGVLKGYRSILNLGNVKGSLDRAIQYLDQGVPVIVETSITHVFQAAPRGYVPEPAASDRILGGHSTLLVGFISESRLEEELPAHWISGNGGYFILKNSWGTSRGDRGYFYVSYRYLEKYLYSLFAVEAAQWVER
jgi:C1A family cysteine protease